MRIRIVLLAMVAVSAFAQTLPQGVEKKASVGGITEYDYPNGLRVLLFPDPSSPKVTVNMTYLVGSRFEGYGETGMAHLLEHMNFILTTNGRNIKKELTDHGASWNGTTDYDRTNYFETVTAGDDNLKWALGLEADRMVNMRIEKPLLDTEMTVVRNEFERGENSPERILEERVVATAYLWHNYGKSVIGTRADIEKVPIDRLAAFYRKYYQPDNAVLVIAGQFDQPKALAFVAQTCGAIPRPTRKLEEPYTVEPVQDGERSVELRRVGNNQAIMMAWHAPALSNQDSAALEVLSGIMSGGGRGGSTGRLYKALVDNKKALSARMGYEELHDPGFVLVQASLSKDQSLDDARKAIIDTVAGAVTEPPTKEEVDREKNRILQGMQQQMNNSQQAALGLSEMIASGDWRLFFLNYDQIKAVTPEDVARVAKLYFKASNRTVGEFIPTPDPDRTEVPAGADLSKVFDNYKSSLDVAAGEAFDPSPANIEKHLTRSVLPNGLKVVMLPKSTRGNVVSASLQVHFGDVTSLSGKDATGSMTGALLMRGTKTRTRQQIQDEMVKLNARIAVSGGVDGASASIQTTAENLVPAMQLAADILRNPSFPDSDFEQIKKQRIAAQENRRSDPGSQATLALARTLNPYPRNDPRYVGTIDEDIEDIGKVTLEDVKKFYTQFYGASHGELVIVGQVDTGAASKAAAELFGNWSNAASYKRITEDAHKVTPVNLKIETPDKQDATFSAAVIIPMRDTDPDYPAMVLANYMFGGSITSRMEDRIRNREGLSYGATSQFRAPADGNNARFEGRATSNPKNTPKVEASFMDELSKTLAGGFTEKEVDEAKKAVHDQRIVGRSQDQQLLNLIATREEYGRTLDWDRQMDAKLEALTADRVNAAFRRHVDASAVSIVKAGDFKTAGVYQQ
ncbi:MAG TPA: pitrilysin family protein [Bryobacteraceae bacterium]|jgi:zinc protease|nr:pitrilysin family protein [Bryobacteraceae bacterium]